MSDNGIVWEEPESLPSDKVGHWLKDLAPLVEHPGQWARIAVYPYQGKAAGISARFKSRQYRIPEPHHRWEFVTRQVAKGSKETALYGRYLGPPEESA